MEDQSVIDHIIEMKGDIASIKAMLKPLADHERRLGRVESDVRIYKRIFTGLWLLLVAGVAATANWLKGN